MVEATRTHRVLIVEDEYYLAADLERAFRAEGAEVIGPVCELSDAFCEVDRGGFDAAVVDINLRGELAYDIADELMRRSIPFIFATGYSSEAIPLRFSEVVRFEKPFEPPAVARRVLQLCRP
jgi:DNA-binding response OmpR family regulator